MTPLLLGGVFFLKPYLFGDGMLKSQQRNTGSCDGRLTPGFPGLVADPGGCKRDVEVIRLLYLQVGAVAIV